MVNLSQKIKEFKERRAISRSIKEKLLIKFKKERMSKFDERAKEIISREDTLSQVREAQARRARAEASILRARASQRKSKLTIQGGPLRQKIGPATQFRSFTDSKNVKKGKRKKQKGTQGIGTSFRVI